MRRIAEAGLVILLCIVGMNLALISFGSSINGSASELTSVAPTQEAITGLYADVNTAVNSISINPLVVWKLPIAVGGAIKNIFTVIYNVLFGFNNVIVSLQLPSAIQLFVLGIINTIVIVVLLVVILDIISSLSGGNVGG